MPRLEPIFLTLDNVLVLHQRGIAEHGGDNGLRDQGLLESAVAMPQVTFGGDFMHPTLASMAAAYAFHLAQNQPFIDGNKRVGAAAALVFLALNDQPLDARANGPLYDAMIAVGERKMDKAGLVTVCEALMRL